MTDPKDQTIAQQFGVFGLIVTQFLGYSGAGMGLGYVLWKRIGLPWWTMALFGFAGLALAVYRIVLYQKRLGTK